MDAPTFPKLPSHPTLLDHAKYHFDFLRLRFEVTFGLYVLTPHERVLGYFLVGGLLFVLGYSVLELLLPLLLVLGGGLADLLAGAALRVHPNPIHHLDTTANLLYGSFNDTVLASQRCQVALGGVVDVACEKLLPAMALSV